MVEPRYIAAIVAVIIFAYIVSSISATWAAMEADLRVALTMIFFVWLLNWARKNLGSPRLAILFALVIAYLVFYKHPEVVWWIFGAMILTTFGAKIIGDLGPSGPDKGKALDAYKAAQPTIEIKLPSTFSSPYQYPPPWDKKKGDD